jgi:hypothetical protein
VYEANVVIQGVMKRSRSSFFPKQWTRAQVEQAIDEAYQSRSKYGPLSGIYRGYSADGIEIELRLDSGHGIDSAYPIFQGAKW